MLDELEIEGSINLIQFMLQNSFPISCDWAKEFEPPFPPRRVAFQTYFIIFNFLFGNPRFKLAQHGNTQNDLPRRAFGLFKKKKLKNIVILPQ